MLRIAFSPTEDMNINDLRIALLNYILAKQLNEELLIRIEDLNKENNIEGKEKEILKILNLFSIDYTRVVYQSENIKYHQRMAMQLLTQKKAFSCFCPDEKLEELNKEAKANNKPYHYDGFCATLSDETVLNVNAPFTVRIKMPEKAIQLNDTLQGKLSYEPFEVDSFIILKHDKTPTNDYASSVDDMLYNISTVIQEEKHMVNTPKQIHIRQLLGYDKEINYTHLPLILDPQTHKEMTNQDNEANRVSWLISEGFLPVALANYLVLMGNNTPTEIFTLEEAVKWLSVDKFSKDSVLFDLEKLKYINKKHLEIMEDMRLSKLLGFADESIGKLGKLFLEEVSTLKEMKSKINLIFANKETLKEAKKEFDSIKQCLQTAPFFDDFEDLKTYILQKTHLNEAVVVKPLRYLLTGEIHGPNLSDVYGCIKNYLGEIVK